MNLEKFTSALQRALRDPRIYVTWQGDVCAIRLRETGKPRQPHDEILTTFSYTDPVSSIVQKVYAMDTRRNTVDLHALDQRNATLVANKENQIVETYADKAEEALWTKTR